MKQQELKRYHDTKIPPAIPPTYLQTYDITESHYSGTNVQSENKFKFISKHFTKTEYSCCENFTPPSESCDDEIVNTANQSAYDKHERLLSTFFPCDKKPVLAVASGTEIYRAFSATKYFLNGIGKEFQALHQTQCKKYLVKMCFEIKNV